MVMIAQGSPVPSPFYVADLVRSQTSHSSGSWSFELTINAAIDVTKIGVGIDNNVESLTSEAGHAGAIAWLGDGKVNYNGVIGAYSAQPFAVGNVLGVDVNLTGGTMRVKVNGGSFSSNFSISAIIGGPMFALAQMKNSGDQVTANFTGPFTFTMPSTAWG